MKRFKILSLVFLGAIFPKQVQAHTILGDASTLTRGTLPNERLDASSVTLLGPKPAFSSFSGGIGSTQIVAGATLLSVFSNGIPQGNANTINAVGQIGSSISGSTWTIVGSTSSARDYTISVGTPGAQNVDFTVATDTDLIAPLAALGANGLLGTLTPNTTVHGRILFVGQGAQFNIMNATIPAGVTFAMVKGSSTCWLPSQTTGTILTAYGDGVTPSLENFWIDGSSKPGFAGQQVVLSTNVIVNGLKLTNFRNPSLTNGLFTNLISIIKSTNVIINDLFMDNFGGRIEQVAFGDGASIIVDQSSSVYFNRPIFGKFIGNGSNFSAMSFSRSSDWHIRDGIFNNAFGDYIAVNGANKNFEIARNVFHVNGVVNSNRGIFSFVAQQYAATSTGTVTGNSFYSEPGASGQSIIGLSNNTFPTNGIIFSFNLFYAAGSGVTTTAINVQANCSDNFFLYNFGEGLPTVVDAGTRTRIVQ